MGQRERKGLGTKPRITKRACNVEERTKERVRKKKYFGFSKE
jgi:hypothetical protein